MSRVKIYIYIYKQFFSEGGMYNIISTDLIVFLNTNINYLGS